MLLIGSRATKFWHPDYKVGMNSDWDVIASHDEAEKITKSSLNPCALSWKYGRTELHNASFLNNEEIYKYASNQYLEIEDDLCPLVCSSRGLAAIKRSHLHRSLKFATHMLQYQILDKDFDAMDWDFIRCRASLTKFMFGNRAGSKAKSNEEFFQDAVVRDFPHDELHRIIAENGQPLYLKVKNDINKAAYDHVLWHKLSDLEKVRIVQEECYVIALERWLIPYKKQGRNYPYGMAFDRALEKACTTLDDGPFREYAIDHWPTVRRYDAAVFNRFFNSKLYEHSC